MPARLGSDIVVEDNAVILDGSVVADGVVIEANSIVFPRSTLEAGKLYAGMPAKPVRDLRPGEIEERAARIRARIGSATPIPASARHGEIGGPVLFVAGDGAPVRPHLGGREIQHLVRLRARRRRRRHRDRREHQHPGQ